MSDEELLDELISNPPDFGQEAAKLFLANDELRKLARNKARPSVLKKVAERQMMLSLWLGFCIGRGYEQANAKQKVRTVQ